MVNQFFYEKKEVGVTNALFRSKSITRLIHGHFIASQYKFAHGTTSGDENGIFFKKPGAAIL